MSHEHLEIYKHYTDSAVVVDNKGTISVEGVKMSMLEYTIMSKLIALSIIEAEENALLSDDVIHKILDNKYETLEQFFRVGLFALRLKMAEGLINKT